MIKRRLNTAVLGMVLISSFGCTTTNIDRRREPKFVETKIVDENEVDENTRISREANRELELIQSTQRNDTKEEGGFFSRAYGVGKFCYHTGQFIYKVVKFFTPTTTE